MRADAGVVISASHNPYQDNGIKIFAADGFKLPDEVEADIERRMEAIGAGNDGARAAPDAIGKAVRIDDAVGRYVQFLKQTFPKEHTLDGIKVVVDCSNGAAYQVAPQVFQELGAEVIELNVWPDGRNINDGCGALHPEMMAEEVRRAGADLGVALDGDADRLILADEKGTIVDGDQVMAILGTRMLERRQLPEQTVVATVMSNLGLERALSAKGGKLLRTAVGDRYVVEAMRERGLSLGGEQSGHIIFLDHATTGDGMVAALRVLSVMVAEQRPLSELALRDDPVPPGVAQLRGRQQAAVRGDAGRAAGDRGRHPGPRRRRARGGALLRNRVEGARDDRGDGRGEHPRPGRRDRQHAAAGAGPRMIRLYVNVDHVATLRQQRGTRYPDPVAAATLCELAGADGITVHLREDRRHIQDRDVRVLKETVRGVLNLEMAATDEMLRIAREVKPDFCTLVPEKREERTTEGGLSVGPGGQVERVARGLAEAGIGVSLFIDPDPRVVEASARLGVGTVELHTGDYCLAPARGAEMARQLQRLELAARAAGDAGLRLGAGHGLDYANLAPVVALPGLEELNIGHGLVARAVLMGMRAAVEELRAVIAGGAGA